MSHYHGLLRNGYLQFMPISKEAIYVAGEFSKDGVITLTHPERSAILQSVDKLDQFGNPVVEKGRQVQERRMMERNHIFSLYGEDEVYWFINTFVDNAEQVLGWIKPADLPEELRTDKPTETINTTNNE